MKQQNYEILKKEFDKLDLEKNKQEKLLSSYYDKMAKIVNDLNIIYTKKIKLDNELVKEFKFYVPVKSIKKVR